MHDIGYQDECMEVSGVDCTYPCGPLGSCDVEYEPDVNCVLWSCKDLPVPTSAGTTVAIVVATLVASLASVACGLLLARRRRLWPFRNIIEERQGLLNDQDFRPPSRVSLSSFSLGRVTEENQPTSAERAAQTLASTRGGESSEHIPLRGNRNGASSTTSSATSSSPSAARPGSISSFADIDEESPPAESPSGAVRVQTGRGVMRKVNAWFHKKTGNAT